MHHKEKYGIKIILVILIKSYYGNNTAIISRKYFKMDKKRTITIYNFT